MFLNIWQIFWKIVFVLKWCQQSREDDSSKLNNYSDDQYIVKVKHQILTGTARYLRKLTETGHKNKLFFKIFNKRQFFQVSFKYRNKYRTMDLIPRCHCTVSF